jgi:hypothetical protein
MDEPVRSQPDVTVRRAWTWLRHAAPWCVALLPIVVFGAAGLGSARAEQMTVQTGAAKNPHGAIDIPCASCHTFTSWKPIRQAPDFDHRRTGYPLVGGHRGVDCTSCHTSLVFKNASTRCADCHADLHRGQFGKSCDRCHTVRAWETSQVATRTSHQNRFPLVLAHAVADCQACHKGAASGQFQGLSTQCYACHARDFQATTGPSHVKSGFSTTCEQCHTMSSWEGASFDHAQTGFTMADYRATTSPNHVTGSMPTTCDQCHTVDSWLHAKFDHAQTGFALAGAHATVSCVACHVGNNYALTSANTTCASCHMADYQATTNPNHVTGRMPTTCDQCHTTSAWQGAAFDHSRTGFALSGAHATTVCTACHVNNNYALTSANAACSSCHMTDYQNTTNPKHSAATFPTDCSVCHSTTNWAGAVFNHAATGWALTGSHASADCTACHVGGNYNLTSANTACIGCHQKDFSGATSPVNHAAFPTTCNTCHDTATWTNATFDHSSTGFTLTGAHTSLACASCHVNNNYSLTGANTACVSCHQTDYNNTNTPNHRAASFPTTCTTCHGTTTWAGATFTHTWFPTSHGNANGQCATCHTNASDYGVFQCTGCHSASQTNSRHSTISGYVYNSVNCYACHPKGNGG